MAAKDIFHDACVRALQKDGWNVTHDPLTISVGKTDLLVDLGAEEMVAAEKGGERIAVEIKSFLKPSFVQDLKEASGQFLIYREALLQSPESKDRVLYLAVRDVSWETIATQPVGAMMLRTGTLRFVVFDPVKEIVTKWIPSSDTET